MPATLGDLARRVQLKLRDTSGTKWPVPELWALLNEAQDRFTRDTEYLRAWWSADLPANLTTPLLPAAPKGYQMGRWLVVQFFNGAHDFPLDPLRLDQISAKDPNWRRSPGQPVAYVRGIDPHGATANPDFLWPWPTTGTDYPEGIRLCHVLETNNQMGQTEDMQMALPDRVAADALVSYAVAEAALRGPRYGKVEVNKDLVASCLAKWNDDLEAAAVEAARGIDRPYSTSRVRTR